MVDITRLGGSYLRTIRSCLHYLVYTTIVFVTIVNNGNILEDGTDEKKYLLKKYTDLQFHLII